MASSSNVRSAGDGRTKSTVSDRNRPRLRLADCKCPICMCILVEPVRMPCDHEVCMPCFRQNVEEANFTCPLCRLRISSWARRRAREKALVDRARWAQIQRAFPDRCRRRMAGEEEDEDENDEDDQVLDFLPVKRICEPGAIKQEYMEAIEKLKEERQQMEVLEIKKSEDYIAWLQREEVRLYEEQRDQLAHQQMLDEELARKMSQDVSPPQEEIRAHLLQEQAAKDEEFAWQLQREIESSETLPSPQNVAATTTIVSKKTSRNSSRSNSGGASSKSSIKCHRIDTFLSPSSKQTSDRARHGSKASSSSSTSTSSSSSLSASSKSSRDASASPGLSVSSASSRRASTDSSVSSLDFEKPSTSSGGLAAASTAAEAVLFGDPPWGEPSNSSSDCILEVVIDPADSPEAPYPSPGADSESGKSFKDSSLLGAEFVLVAGDADEVDEEEEEEEEEGRNKESAFESVGKKSADRETAEAKSLRKRSDSMTSTDSISPELNHFRPIHVSPRTSRRRLGNGRRDSPPIVHTTPRNLAAAGLSPGAGVPAAAGDNAPLPPLVKAKFDSLIREKLRRLPESSKGTMTGSRVAAASGTSSLMREELSKRLNRKPAGNRHTLFLAASHRQTSSLADDKTKPSKTPKEPTKEATKEPTNQLQEHSNSTLPKCGLEAASEDTRAATSERDRASGSSSDRPENQVHSEAGTAVQNGSLDHSKNGEAEAPPGREEVGGETGRRAAKRKARSPQRDGKRQRLDGSASPEKAGAGDDGVSGKPTRSPGKVYRMKASKPKPGQSTVKQLFTAVEPEPTQECSPKSSNCKKTAPAQQPSPLAEPGGTPPLPSLVPSPHPSRLKTDVRRKAVSVSPRAKRAAPENSQENAATDADRHKLAPGTPDKGILMDANLGANREHNGSSDRGKAGEATPPVGRKSGPRSASPADARPREATASPPSPAGPLQRTPSKTRRNTIWKYMELVGEEERRLRQEEEDRQLALQLQREFDKQERHRLTQVDRTRGTEAAYELRIRKSSRKVAAEAVREIDSDDDIFA